MEVFTSSPNLKYDRSMLRSEMNLIFNRLVARCFKKLKKKYAFVRPLEGDARTKYGDYVCLSVLEVCEEIRKSDPYLFDKKSPRAIAEKIMRGIRNQDVIFNMINQQSILVHDAGMITFRLDGSWIAHRIDEMLINGIDTWAPKLYDRKARAIVVSSEQFPLSGTHSLIDCMKPVLADILLYSGIDVFVPPKNRDGVNLATICYGVCNHKADVMVCVTPHLERGYIEKCFAAARSEKWFRAHPKPTLAWCGCGSISMSSDQKCNLLRFLHSHDFLSLSAMAEDYSIYNGEEFFHCLIKYTFLKKYRLAEVTLGTEEMIKDGNTLVNILRTKAIISNITKNSISRGKLSKSEKALAGEGERELGLHLVEFTGVVEKACRNLAPHLLCEYLVDLSKLFTSYHLAIGKASVQLCRATEVVINQCFHLLGIFPIFPSQLIQLNDLLSTCDGERRANDQRFPQSRFELLTMRVFVAHPDFDKGTIFGNIWVKDANLARPNGWTMVDDNQCYVSYFNHEWHQPLYITYGSLIPFGDPSCRRSVPISSSLEVHVLLHAMSENKKQCYLLFHGKDDEKRSKKWYEQRDAECPEAECGTMELESDVGTVLINYILMKNAVDALMELLFWSSKPNVCVKIRGSITASYGDELVKDDDILGRYKAVIFRTTEFESTRMEGVLPLQRSLLAVPANWCLKIKANLVDVVSGTKYVCEKSCCATPGIEDNLLIECGDFSINLTVAWKEVAWKE